MRSGGCDPTFSISHVRHLGYSELHLSLNRNYSAILATLVVTIDLSLTLIKCHCRSFMMSLTFISTIYELFHHFLSIASSFEQF
jgi:hypothetical protein